MHLVCGMYCTKQGHLIEGKKLLTMSIVLLDTTAAEV